MSESGLVDDVVDLAGRQPLHVERRSEDVLLDALIVSDVPRRVADGNDVLVDIWRDVAQRDRGRNRPGVFAFHLDERDVGNALRVVGYVEDARQIHLERHRLSRFFVEVEVR